MHTILDPLRTALSAAGRDPANYRTMSDGTRWLALPTVREIGAAHYAAVRDLPLPTLFDTCETLLDARDPAQRTIAFEWAFRRRRDFTPAEFERFDRWLETYVDDWSSCDDLCTHTFGHLLLAYPDLQPRTRPWLGSDNRWRRRAAAVILIPGLREGTFLDAAFAVADGLLIDRDDLVQKGYGWMLKEASAHAPDRVFAYVLDHQRAMPRTALRYAIEKLPAAQRAAAMSRTWGRWFPRPV